MPRFLFGRALVSFVGLTMLLVSAALRAYPLDGYESTGIARLLHQRGVQEGQIEGKKRPAGELLPLEQVRLRLLDQPELDLPSADAELTGVIKRLLGQHADRYGIALLDLSDVDHPQYAVLNGATRQNPGSVGKVLVGLAIFQALADIYPNDIEARNVCSLNLSSWPTRLVSMTITRFASSTPIPRAWCAGQSRKVTPAQCIRISTG